MKTKFRNEYFKTRKFMIMNKELHPRNDVAQLYVSRKNGAR